MEDRIEELEMMVSSLKEQIKTLQIDVFYIQQQIDNNSFWIEQEEKSKILA